MCVVFLGANSNVLSILLFGHLITWVVSVLRTYMDDRFSLSKILGLFAFSYAPILCCRLRRSNPYLDPRLYFYELALHEIVSHGLTLRFS